MDLSPRALGIRLPLLGALLALEGLVGLISMIVTAELTRTTFADIPLLVWTLVYGVVLLRNADDHLDRDTCRSLAYAGLVPLAFTPLYQGLLSGLVEHPGPGDFAQAAGTLATALAAPALLGGALALKDDPANGRPAFLGRLAGITALTGLALHAFTEAYRLMTLQGYFQIQLHIDSGRVFFLLLYLSSRSAMLACAIISLQRPRSEDSSAPAQDLKIRLMIAWGILSLLLPVSASIYYLLRYHRFVLSWIWISYLGRAFLEVTLVPILAILLAIALEKPGLGYKSIRPTHPSSGAEA